MKKIVFTIMIGIAFSSCNKSHTYVNYYDEEDETEDTIQETEDEVVESAIADNNLDSVAIGNIYLGIDEHTFYAEKRDFLTKNPRLNGVKIEFLDGKFYNGKLYYITVVSEKNTIDIYKELTDEEKNAHYVWSSLYKEKYRNAKYRKEYGTYNLYLRKGKCTIKVEDCGSEVYTQEDLKIQHQRIGKVSGYPKYYYRSYIHIYDESVIKQMAKDNEDAKIREARKTLDVI